MSKHRPSTIHCTSREANRTLQPCQSRHASLALPKAENHAVGNADQESLAIADAEGKEADKGAQEEPRDDADIDPDKTSHVPEPPEPQA